MVATAAEDRVALAERVGVRTPVMLVELTPIGLALILATDEEGKIDADGVGVAEVAAAG